MIVDTSVLVAVLLGDDGWEQLSETMIEAETLRISAPAWVEFAAVIEHRLPPQIRRRVERLVEAYGIRIESFTPEQALIARRALRDYGRESGHPARLGLGEAFSYALAADADEPLLHVGDGFGFTDLPSAPG